MIELTKRTSEEASQIRFEQFLWVAVPPFLLAVWMYLLPTSVRSASWSVFNSWASLAVPLVCLAIALYVRLRADSRTWGFLRVPITLVSVVWWVVFAAFLKWIVFKLLWFWSTVADRM